MKILLAHSDPHLAPRVSIDLWRIIRPFKELAKHVDWQIDSTPYLLPHLVNAKTGDTNPQAVVRDIQKLKDYDIIWSSYFPDAKLFDTMQFVTQKFGTKFVLDIDDNFYDIPKDNSIWENGGWEMVKQIQYMIENTDFLVTSSPLLLNELKKRRVSKVGFTSKPNYVLPNFVGRDYKHKAFDNKDKVWISFFGSVTHARDLKESGFIEALQKLMHKHKNVYFGSIGLKVTDYLPKDRYVFHPGVPGHRWVTEVWPNINCDIAVAPLLDNNFNRCKTNIKWLETAMIPAAFVGSDVKPYKGSVVNGKTGLLVPNTAEAWYKALDKLVTSKRLRTRLATSAKKEVLANWNIENNWTILKDIIEQVNGYELNKKRSALIIQA